MTINFYATNDYFSKLALARNYTKVEVNESNRLKSITFNAISFQKSGLITFIASSALTFFAAFFPLLSLPLALTGTCITVLVAISSFRELLTISPAIPKETLDKIF
jgi:hypothetical protein